MSMADKSGADLHSPSGGKTRVLLIDDSRFIRASAAKMFGDEFELVLAEDGREGWKTIQQDTEIQVVFTDLVMPEMDGFELLERVRTSHDEGIRNLPVIMLTGADNSEAAQEKAFALGATDFINKPFKANDVKVRARSHAHYRRKEQDLQGQITLDALTGLLNKRGLQSQLERDLSLVKRHREEMTVMVIELDAFKDLFVRIGRDSAEAIVKKVGRVLLQSVRREDAVARTGLARFVLSLPMARGERSLELAERICKKVESFRAHLNGKHLNITVSVGVCILGEVSGALIDVDTLQSVAQESYYRAVARGRSQIFELSVEKYLREQQEVAEENVSIDELLQQIERGEVEQVARKLDVAIDKLAPLLVLLSNEQKQRVITYR